MAQQKSKKNATPWIQCDKCLVNLLNKDIEFHSSDCPPNLARVSYNFVKNNILYGTLDIKTNENIQNLSSKEKNNLVFLSQSVIQLCGFSIGDWAILHLLDASTSPIARIVWPTVEKHITSVLLTDNSLNLSFVGSIGKYVAVSKVPNEMRSACTVNLILLNAQKSLDISQELCNRVHKSFVNQVLTVGNKLSIMFYGKILKFEITTIRANYNEANIENDFSKLLINDKYKFYKTDGSTKWTLYRDKDHYQTAMLETNNYTTIAGVDEEVSEIRDIMNDAVNRTNTSKLIQCKSVLIYGNSGTGKTAIAQALAKESKANIVSISAPDIYSQYSTSIEETIKQHFQTAAEHSPSVIIIDEIDLLCPQRSNRLTDTEKRVVSTLLLMFDKVYSQNSNIFIIATTNKPDNIDPCFRRCGRLDREIEIPTPSPKNRQAILVKLLNEMPNDLNESDIRDISMNTHGFVGADLVSLCSRANLISVRKGNSKIQSEDFKYALKKVRPSAMREVQIEVPDVKWSDIGGQDNLKLILRQSVEWPLKYSKSFLRLGITPPKGVLMFGPPGCSKTMIAKALATESGLNFLSIKGPELFSKWVGESEKAVREVFRKARQVAPSVIFFDEIDAVGGERSSGSSTSVQERVLAQLLTELDGISPLGDVTILAATNRPDRIDKALLRPGRLDRIVYVPLPDYITRREIFRIKFSKMPVVNVSIDDLVEKTEGYSGAEVNAVCHEAAMIALEEDLQIEHIQIRHFAEALKLVTPRTPLTLIKVYEDYLQINI